MKHLAVVTVVAVLAACSSTAPQNGFAGNWQGIANQADLITVTTQNDSNVAGSGTLTRNNTTTGGTITGTSMRPNLNFTLTLSDGGDEWSFTGFYATSDSVSGFLADETSGLVFPFSLRRR